MIVLGIDPGYAIVGYGVLRYENTRFTVLEYGAVRTSSEMEFSARLLRIYEDIGIIADRWKPDIMGIEQLFFNTNSMTAIGVAQARGCVLLSAAKRNVRICEYTPLQVKQAVTGYGRADKNQMQEMTRALLGLDSVPKPDDTADALAVAICCAHCAPAPAVLKRPVRG